MKTCPQCNLKYPTESATCFLDGSALVEIPDPRIGTTIAGRYLIEEVIGEGGMATVYRARHRLVDRPCAVKIMNHSFTGNDVIRERFRREARSAQKLAHPNIIEIFDQGDTDDGSMYLVMELLDGETLADVLDRGRMPLDQALPILIQIARALARAHDLEVIHRDLKPENIFLVRQPDGSTRVVLLDFGIARSTQDSRLTGNGEVFGTPQYMAPERITSIDAGPAADLYSVGVIIFELLTGRLPFEAQDVASFFLKHMKEDPPSLRSIDASLPEAVDKLALELMEKDPADRPVDAHRLHNDLCSIAGAIGVRIPGDPSVAVESSRRPARTLPPVAIDRWVRRTAVFELMLQTAYADSRPEELGNLLEQVKKLVQEVSTLRNTSVNEQRKLESVEQRERDCRQRFGHAVDALGIDASRARDELKAAVAGAAALGVEVDARLGEVKKSHAKILFWEGRSAFAEPYAELSAAYRRTAELIDKWARTRKHEKHAGEHLREKQSEVADLEFQIKELRTALASQTEALETERTRCQERVAERGNRADALESELLELASRFCAPLRGRPELGLLFRELEADAA